MICCSCFSYKNTCWSCICSPLWGYFIISSGERRQEQNEKQELSCLPSVHLKDIPRDSPRVQLEHKSIEGVPLKGYENVIQIGLGTGAVVCSTNQWYHAFIWKASHMRCSPILLALFASSCIFPGDSRHKVWTLRNTILRSLARVGKGCLGAATHYMLHSTESACALCFCCFVVLRGGELFVGCVGGYTSASSWMYNWYPTCVKHQYDSRKANLGRQNVKPPTTFTSNGIIYWRSQLFSYHNARSSCERQIRHSA